MRLLWICLLLGGLAHAAPPLPEIDGWQDYQAGRWQQARDRFQRAAAEGNRVAAFNLAIMHWRGESVPVNYDKALRWLRVAADKRLPQAEYVLGLLYEHGDQVPRSQPHALIEEPAAAVAQVLRMLREGVVRSYDGVDVPIRADTVCIHGDGPQAAALARRLREELATAGIAVKPVPV